MELRDLQNRIRGVSGSADLERWLADALAWFAADRDVRENAWSACVYCDLFAVARSHAMVFAGPGAVDALGAEPPNHDTGSEQIRQATAETVKDKLQSLLRHMTGTPIPGELPKVTLHVNSGTIDYNRQTFAGVDRTAAEALKAVVAGHPQPIGLSQFGVKANRLVKRLPEPIQLRLRPESGNKGYTFDAT